MPSFSSAIPTVISKALLALLTASGFDFSIGPNKFTGFLLAFSDVIRFLLVFLLPHEDVTDTTAIKKHTARIKLNFLFLYIFIPFLVCIVL